MPVHDSQLIFLCWLAEQYPAPLSLWYPYLHIHQPREYTLPWYSVLRLRPLVQHIVVSMITVQAHLINIWCLPPIASCAIQFLPDKSPVCS